MGEAIMEEKKKPKHQKTAPGKKGHDKNENGAVPPKDPKEKNQPRSNPQARLIIRNISFNTTEETLKKHFESYGDIHDVKVLKKPNGKLVGCAFVQFKNVPMAKQAILKTNMQPFLGRPISVDFAIAKNKFMQHLDQQQLELKKSVKVESDSEDDGDDDIKVDLDGDLKEEIKSESENSEDESEDEEEDDDNDEGEDEDEDEEEEMEHDNDSQINDKRVKLNDAEDGCTVFVRNVPFSSTDADVRALAERTGPVRYALICVDPMTEHPKGTAFIKFQKSEDASKFLELPESQLMLDRQPCQPSSALRRDHVGKGRKKEPKDSRNLYLVKEGVIMAGSRAAVGLSASDMAKRLALEQSKTQMLKNLNRFVSKYRLVVSNLPGRVDDAELRRTCATLAPRGAVITEARVMKDLRAPTYPNGKHQSKGYGFVMFMRHEDALACLRKLNNNPDIFDAKNRPIVSFSIEDRAALNARKKRLEKSVIKNPLHKNFQDGKNRGNKPLNETQNSNHTQNQASKRKNEVSENGPLEPKGKKTKFDKRKQNDVVTNKNPEAVETHDDFVGIEAKAGTQQKIRNRYRLNQQAQIHHQHLKTEKKNNKYNKLKKLAKERIKQPPMKMNKKKEKPKKRSRNKPANEAAKKNPVQKKQFSDLVNKYKSKLVSSNSLNRVKAKWYE